MAQHVTTGLLLHIYVILFSMHGWGELQHHDVPTGSSLKSCACIIRPRCSYAYLISNLYNNDDESNMISLVTIFVIPSHNAYRPTS